MLRALLRDGAQAQVRARPTRGVRAPLLRALRLMLRACRSTSLLEGVCFEVLRMAGIEAWQSEKLGEALYRVP